MARRSSSIAVASGPGFTDLFRADDVGGTDGGAIRIGFVSVPATAAAPVEYRVDDPADPAGEVFALQPGDGALVRARLGVKHVSARGVGGASTAGFEVVESLD